MTGRLARLKLADAGMSQREIASTVSVRSATSFFAAEVARPR